MFQMKSSRPVYPNIQGKRLGGLIPEFRYRQSLCNFLEMKESGTRFLSVDSDISEALKDESQKRIKSLVRHWKAYLRIV